MAPQLEGVNSLYAGIMGAGKTFAILHNTRNYDRIVAYDQSKFLFEEVTRFGGLITTDPKAVTDILNEAVETNSGYRVGLVDESGQHRDWMIDQIDELTSQPDPGERPSFPAAFWVEEAASVFPATPFPDIKYPIMMKLLRGSRHRRLHNIFGTQLPNDLPKKMRGLLNDIWAFRVPDDEHAMAVARKLGRKELAPLIQELEDELHYHRDQRGRLTGPKRIRSPAA